MSKNTWHNVAVLIHNDLYTILATIQCGGNIAVCMDLGIAKYHFEIGAGKENIDWV